MNTSSSNPADNRLSALEQWLATLAPRHGLDLATLAPASSDASFRRYFRLSGGTKTLIVMDAPPPKEDCRPFVHVTQLLQQANVHVPDILEHDLAQGFLLLSDLGRHTYYQAIQTQPADHELQAIYRDALDALVKLQQAPVTGLPVYDKQRLHDELTVFPEWYIARHCGVELSDAQKNTLAGIFERLVNDAAAQPRVLVHRDFHSPNLMLGAAGSNPGVIDYQDALLGPVSYDIASLVMDARTTWEEPQQLDWAIRYWEKARAAALPVPDDFADFHRQYEWMSLQRNLRILGVFARLAWRDDKTHYLDHIPRVLAYTRQVAGRYNALRALIPLLDTLENKPPAYGYTF